MARSRKKKRNPQEPDHKKRTYDTEVVDIPSPAAKKVLAPESLENRREKSGVRLSTCLGGMFLTLVLGMYIGSLLPGILNDISTPDTPAPVDTPPALAEKIPTPTQVDAPAPPPEKPSIPASLANRMEELEKKLVTSHDDGPTWVELGNLYFDTNQYRKAIGAYEHALAISPNNPDVLTDLGIMYREAGEFTRALECFRKASSLDGRHRNALFNEGVVLAYDLHKNAEALSAWEKLLAIDPGATAPDGKALKDMVSSLRQSLVQQN